MRIDRNSHVLFDESDSLGDAAANNVGVGPGLRGQPGPRPALRPLPLERREAGHLGVEAGDGAEHGAARVRDELLAHRLQPPVHVLLGVKEVFLDGGGGVQDELQQGVVTVY